MISNILSLIKKDYLEKEKKINNFLSVKFLNLPGEELIEKYYYLFINPKKKSIYYKNIAIRNIHSLLKNK
jgi:hypothetical protein